MLKYDLPKIAHPKPVPERTVLLIANGDLRLSANQSDWPYQAAMEEALVKAFANEGWDWCAPILLMRKINMVHL